MKTFLTLEEFLTLLDQTEPKYARALLTEHKTGPEWVALYKRAKQSWEEYGDEGPPVGAPVITLESGHGGRGGDYRIFEGIETTDPRYFLISRQEINWQGSRKYVSMVLKDFWWKSIYVDPTWKKST